MKLVLVFCLLLILSACSPTKETEFVTTVNDPLEKTSLKLNHPVDTQYAILSPEKLKIVYPNGTEEIVSIHSDRD